MHEKLQYIKNYVDFINNEYLNVLKSESEINNKFGFLQKEIQEMISLESLTRKISEYYSEKYLKSLEVFIQEGLHFIFDDRNYKMKIEVIDKKVGKEVKFWLIENDTLESDMDSIGSGIKCVISFLIQVFIIEKLRGGKYLFLDESFTEISQEYIETLFNYIKKIVKELGFNILLVSHMEEHLKYFDKVYEVKNGLIEVLS